MSPCLSPPFRPHTILTTTPHTSNMSTSSSPFIEHLPEELLLQIFSHLDSQPPSVTKSREEPSLQITSSNTHTYKDISRVSHRWRRMTLPLLFKFSRIRLIQADETAVLEPFLQFVRESELIVSSVVITISKDRLPPSSSHDHQNKTSEITTFWHRLVDATKATRIVIVAPPADLARLTQCTIDLSTEWAFEEMDYHLLELSYDPATTINRQAKLFEPVPDRIAAESILLMKPWSHLALNVS